jgi:pilus assembly protein CpaF
MAPTIQEGGAIMTSAVSLIAERVRERVRREGIDLRNDDALAFRLVHEEVRGYSERALGGGAPLLDDEARAAREIIAQLTGFGPLQPLLDDPSIEEIWINAPTKIFVARDGVSELSTLVLTEAQVRDLVERMLQSSGRRVDLSSPFVDTNYE